jgi:hypothetical protein
MAGESKAVLNTVDVNSDHIGFGTVNIVSGHIRWLMNFLNNVRSTGSSH